MSTLLQLILAGGPNDICCCGGYRHISGLNGADVHTALSHNTPRTGGRGIFASPVTLSPLLAVALE